MRDTCGLLIAGQGAARGDRRATGEQQGADDRGEETSRRMNAGPRVARVACDCAYTPPSESRCFGPVVATADWSTTRRCARLATSTSLAAKRGRPELSATEGRQLYPASGRNRVRFNPRSTPPGVALSARCRCGGSAEQRSGKTRKQVSSSSCPAAERRKGIPRRGRNGRSRIRSWCDWMRCWLAGTRLPGEPSGQTPLLAVVLVGGRLGGAARAVHSAASTSTPHSQQPRVPEVGMPVERLPIDVAAGLMRPIWTASRPREERR
jgi:hypothetical protein